MDPVEQHKYSATLSFDGGDLDCGNGLLLMIRQNLDRLEPGELLEISSSEISVEEDLPAWCRLTNNDLLSWTKKGKQRSYLVCKGRFDESGRESPTDADRMPALPGRGSKDGAGSDTKPERPGTLPSRRHREVGIISPFSVMGIGSWPRPAWLIPYLHKHLEGKISDDEFDNIANDAVRLAVAAQERAGVDLVTDGEQRRDNYASFVGNRIGGCQLIPITDLLPLVADPEKFQQELQSLDVPADRVRHPAVTAPLVRKKDIACNELEFLHSISDHPAKIALPGPYLLSRLMWMECISDKVYESREELSQALIPILREEIADLLERGAALVQLDEPVLSEVVFTGAKNTRSFMCGALSERGSTNEELQFAAELINAVCKGFPTERIGMHICRGNWTPDESTALSGSYEPLISLLNSLEIGTVFLEFCTPRAGEVSVLKDLRKDLRVGLGSVNPKTRDAESVESIVRRVETVVEIVGAERLLLVPDCGFATFADNPVSSAEIAERKLRSLHEASQVLRGRYR